MKGDRNGRLVSQPNRPSAAKGPSEEANRGRAWREEEREPAAGDSRLVSRLPTSGQRNAQWKEGPAFHDVDGAHVNGGGGRGGGRFGKEDPRNQARPRDQGGLLVGVTGAIT